MTHLEQLKSVLCDKTGKCSIAGSDEDRAIVDRALQALEAPVQEPVAWMDASGDIYKHELWPNWNPPHTALYTTPPAQPAPVPEGWKLVPVEPTPKMIREGDKKTWSLPSRDCWAAMLAAAPAAPDLQAELDATNRQVEILSDALAESRRSINALVALARADERAALMQLFTDPENQPTQFGTVTAEYMQREILAEREACAKVCDDIHAEYEAKDVFSSYAEAIRARGNT